MMYSERVTAVFISNDIGRVMCEILMLKDEKN